MLLGVSVLLLLSASVRSCAANNCTVALARAGLDLLAFGLERQVELLALCLQRCGDVNRPQQCQTDAECLNSQFCLLTASDSRCLTRVAPGEPCLTDAMCAFGTCCDHVCTASCQNVLPLGARCKDDSQCASGLHCDSETSGRCSLSPEIRICAGHRYLPVSRPLTFAAARENCARQGGFLATPRSAQQNLCLTEMTETYDIWLGYTDQDREGRYKGEDGLGAVKYSNWKSGQPDNAYGGQDCATLWNTKQRGTWDDKQCHLPHRSVCQLPDDL